MSSRSLTPFRFLPRFLCHLPLSFLHLLLQGLTNLVPAPPTHAVTGVRVDHFEGLGHEGAHVAGPHHEYWHSHGRIEDCHYLTPVSLWCDVPVS